jgi:hypothetical protein
MRLFSKPHPVIASALAAAACVAPVCAVFGTAALVPSAWLALLLTPFCFLIGQALLVCGLAGITNFMVGAAVSVLAVASMLSMGQAISSLRPMDAFFETLLPAFLLAASGALPGALLWWILVVRPHNLSAQGQQLVVPPGFKR